jgi:hypothetical protein
MLGVTGHLGAVVLAGTSLVEAPAPEVPFQSFAGNPAALKSRREASSNLSWT